MATLNLAEYEKEALNNLILSLKTKWPTANFKIFGSKVKGIADKESGGVGSDLTIDFNEKMKSLIIVSHKFNITT